MKTSGESRSMLEAGFLEAYDDRSGVGRVPPGTSDRQDRFPSGAQEGPSEHHQASVFAPRTSKAQRGHARSQPHNGGRFSWFVLKLTFTSALGGFIYGYDTGVVSGAILLIEERFELTDVQEEVFVSITIAAAVVAALAGGPAMGRFGRRPVILLAAAVFTIGAGMLAAARSYLTLVVGRLVVGVGIGLVSLASPVYIAEAAPSYIRGKLVMLNTLFVTLGQVVAGVVDGLFSETDGGWRYMFGLSAVPSLFMALGFLFLPKSPRWLVSEGRRKEALVVLQRIRGTPDVHEEMEEMVDAAMDHAGGLKESATPRSLLKDPRIRRALVLGCGLQLLQQLSGINTVVYYSATIYSLAGFSEEASIWLAAVTAGAEAIGVCIGLYFIDKIGRRTLILSSLGLVVTSLIFLGTGFYLYDQETSSSGSTSSSSTSSSNTLYTSLIVGAMMTYLFTFGLGLSSIPWTINAEIYPTHARSLGTSASTTMNWLGNAIVSATFLSLASDDVLGKDGAFWLYASIGATGWICLFFIMPETKGLPLEDIGLLFARDGDPARSGERGDGDSIDHGATIHDAPPHIGGFVKLGDGGPSKLGGEGGAPSS